VCDLVLHILPNSSSRSLEYVQGRPDLVHRRIRLDGAVVDVSQEPGYVIDGVFGILPGSVFSNKLDPIDLPATEQP
jgi:hypothetical protein